MNARLRFASTVVGFALLQATLAVGGYGLVVLAERSGCQLFRWTDRAIVLADVATFYGRVSPIFEGLRPYRDTPLEYPPAALPFLMAPRLLGPSQRVYVVGFIAEMLVLNGLLTAAIACWVARRGDAAAVRRALVWQTAFVGLLGPWVIGRYDTAPALLGFLAAAFWASGRPVAGGLSAALGTLVKIAPGAAALPGVIDELRALRRRRFPIGSASLGLVTVGGLIAWMAWGGKGAFDAVAYHGERGVEIGSAPAGLLYEVARLERSPARVTYAHASSNLVTDRSPAIAKLVPWLQLLLLAAVTARFVFGRRSDVMTIAGAATLAFCVSGKVFSPQYLLWVAPFTAVGPSRRRKYVFLVACAATTVLYPWGFQALVGLRPWAFDILNLRNALLLGLLADMVAHRVRGEETGKTGRVEAVGRPNGVLFQETTVHVGRP